MTVPSIGGAVQSAVYDLLKNDAELISLLPDGANGLYNVLPDEPEMPCLRFGLAKMQRQGMGTAELYDITIIVDVYCHTDSDLSLNMIGEVVRNAVHNSAPVLVMGDWIDAKFEREIRTEIQNGNVRNTRLFFNVTIEND
tara:strand:+ start:2912 stop:3331 length:420 start_codon:yes stop_codon:yes gene_type:complete